MKTGRAEAYYGEREEEQNELYIKVLNPTIKIGHFLSRSEAQSEVITATIRGKVIIMIHLIFLSLPLYRLGLELETCGMD